MIILGIVHAEGVSKKTGVPYNAYVLHGVVKRPMSGDVQVDTAWITPNEYVRSKVKPGDDVMVSRDGEVLVRDHHADVVQALLDRL